jgi:DNA invertase Pin-like site-specific DNA recombinase
VDARVIDLDGVYNPCRPNDRLLLGMKGSISEFELGAYLKASANGTLPANRRRTSALTPWNVAIISGAPGYAST